MPSRPFQIVLVLLLVLCPAAAVFGADQVTIAVSEFGSFYTRERHELTALVIADLSADPRIAVLDRSRLNRILDEQALDLSREIDPGMAAQVGRLTGASVLISGLISRKYDGGHYSVTVRIVGTSTGRVFVEKLERTAGKRSFNLPPVSAELSKRILATIFDHPEDFAASPRESRDARIAKILASEKGDKRPVVSLHFEKPEAARAATASPAVETELGLILQRAGFVVVDEKSAQKVEVEIVGNITAELGAKRGSLFPCRATINLKARESATGKIITIDRESAEAIDLGEQTALNIALENATDALAARLVPLLSR
jgi:hypothetical protein